MLKRYSPQIRRTAICLATALAVSLPGAASAGFLDKAKSKAKSSVVHLSNTANNAKRKQKQRLAQALGHVSGNVPGAELFELTGQFNLMEQLKNNIALMQRMNADYVRFSGGGFGCQAECKAFRAELKATFDDFLLLVEEVPVLDQKPGLYENVARVADLIDVVPPRALYLMWQALDDQLDDVRKAADDIRYMLAALPPLDDVSDIAVYAQMAGQVTADSPLCKWADKEQTPFVDLVQGELEYIAWAISKVEGFVPDVEIKIAVGASAGAAVANGEAETGAGGKPTDAIKIALKILATIPETVNWAIKINVLRAKAVCAGARYLAN